MNGGADSKVAAIGADPSWIAAPFSAEATLPHSTRRDSAKVTAYASSNGTRTGVTTASTKEDERADALNARRIGPGTASRHHTVSSASTGVVPAVTNDSSAGETTRDASPRKSTDAAARSGPSPSAERVRVTRERSTAGSVKPDSAVHPDSDD